MQVSQALNPRRIARSLVTILVVTLIQTVAAPVLTPEISTPKAKAVSGTVTASSGGSGQTIQIPSGVFSVTFTAVGGAGGKGGDDVNTGLNGTTAGRTIITIAVTPGDVIGLYPGNAGAAAGACASAAPGGVGGTDTFPGGAYSINGTYFVAMNFAGGTGGNAGAGGCSGAGGGAGAASIATINSEIVAIAGGAGGGGGTGSGNNTAQPWNGTRQNNGTSFTGEAGTTVGTCTGSYLDSDGGGGGGGGGGYYGGKGGLAPLRTAECAGFSGSPGGNYVASRSTSVTNDLIAHSSNGYVTYDYTVAATTTCSKSTTTVDIYTVESISYTGNCTWTVPSNVNNVDFFAVGGGGGGGGDGGSGGGGGAALLRMAVPVAPSSTVTLKVGGGGAGGSWGYSWGPIAGEATTLTLASGTVFTANGGSGGTAGPNSGAGAGGVAVNGGFAGGAGGSSPTCFNVGSAGKAGVSNTFTGTRLTYGGGGGGGACPNGAATVAAAGANGGGAGGYAVSSSLNAPGANATAGTGSGGGGGVATGTGLKVNGGKGGSGIIVIRYATNASDAFPVSLASSVAGRWTPFGLQVLDSARKGWIDASGTYTAGSVSGNVYETTTGTIESGNSTASTKQNLSAAGDTTGKATFVATEIPTYTMFHIARYVTSGTMSRIITSSGGNWLSGFWTSGTSKTAWHNNNWLAPGQTADVKWLLSTDQLKLYRANGTDVTYDAGTSNVYNSVTGPTGLGINNFAGEESNWQFLDMILFNRNLTSIEIRTMEAYLARVYGLTLDSQAMYTSAETDTALTLDATQSIKSQPYYGGAINDTFTIETWVKPSSSCATGLCQFVVRENAVLLGMEGGTLRFALQGKTVGGWIWTNTSVVVPIDEWHHFAMVKQFTGDADGSLLIYMDGQLVYTKSGSPYASGTYYNSVSSSYALNDIDDRYIYIGTRNDGGQRFYGQIDEVKIWKTARTASDIQLDMHSNDTTSATLQYYWDFNRAVGASTLRIPNIALHANSRSDLWITGTPTFTDVKIESSYGPYKAIRFPRSYITQNNGWTVPDSVTALSLLVVGGGGGGAGAYTPDLNSGGGGGGGGGVFAAATAVNVANERKIKITVGAGGPGGLASSTREATQGFTGQTSFFGTLSAGGGGGGGYVASSTRSNGLDGTSAGGGGGASNYNAAYNSGAGGTSQPTLFGGETWQGFDGGSGAVFVSGFSATGDAGPGGGTLSASRLSPGNGVSSSLSGTATTYGRGGSARGATGYSFAQVAANLGTGGMGQYGASAPGGRGSTGVIWVRYLAASKPSYTPPTNAYLNVGMTETFTTNVAQDSATAWMTRNFRWESTTAGANGPFSTIKQGTGAANAAFSWVPSDTSTSGNRYLYRVVVTDTDQAGLTYQDTSSAVFAVINDALRITGTSTSISKTINIARNETFTITSGTPTYRYSLSPVIPGVTIDTSTAGTAILKISDTASVGTYLETLTVTDSVSASVSIPITINIAAPPALLAAGEVAKNGQMLNLDASNRWGVLGVDGVATNALPWNDMSGRKNNAATNNASAVNGTLCKAPTFSNDFGGFFTFNGTDNCYYTPYLGSQFTSAYTIEAWIRPSSGSITSGHQILSQMYDTGGEQISLVMGSLDVGNGKIYVGFYSGNGWRYVNVGITPVANTWMHIVGTYDGSTLKTYLNGTFLGSTTYSFYGTINTKGYFIGKRWDGNYFYTGAIAEVRAYSLALSDTQVASNFTATKYRFESSNQAILKPSQKYGSLNIETFTVTSGGDTKTIAFAVGNIQGISWDTSSTPGQIKLSVQESLTPGTYNDTITVTDNFGQATTLPIRFTVTKADTITVFVDTPTALNYTGSRANFTLTLKSTGAVGLERSSTLSATVRYKPGGTTCATGGYCRVGNIGPGGGIVFIDTSTAGSDGRIYEAAPQNWSGSDDLSSVATYCSNNSSSIGASQQGIGWGETNTNLAKASCLGGAVGKVNSFNLSNTTGYSDWFIPSRNEGIELAKYSAQTGLLNIGSNWTVGNSGYWSSTESNTTTMYSIGHVGATFNGTSSMVKSDTTKNMVRPVRAFRACWAIDTCTALSTTDTPTAAGVYSMTPSALTNITDLNARYASVQYAATQLTINRIAQRAQTLPIVNLLYPETFTVYVDGGNGDGAVTYSVVNGTASGCAFDYKKLYTTSLGTCAVTVVKAGDRNYLPDTVTAGIYFYAFVMNQPTPAVGSGPNIALTGETAIYRNTSALPTITGLSVNTATPGVTQLIIYGTGFDDTIASRFFVKFWRGIEASGFTINGLDTEITVTVPLGTETGKVIVETANGRAISPGTLTITP